MPFNDPGTGGDRIDWNTVHGALLVFDVKGHEESVTTTFGDKPAIRSDVTVLDGPNKGTVYTDALVFPLVLIGQLRGSIGGMVIGRLGKGTAKVGQAAPWQLEAASEADKAVGERYLAHVSAQAAAAEEPF
jgi:hypothetical protein